ncbi:MAG: acyl-CoA dehydrogenase family protein, partial [Mycobacterium sp.]
MSAQSLKASAAIADEQSDARELVRSWAAGSMAVDAARYMERGDPTGWRPAFEGLAQLGIFGVALPEEYGGADGTVPDLCAMVEEAAAALVPGPVATTALATLVLDGSHPKLLEALAAGERTAGVALRTELTYSDGSVSGVAPYVLGGSEDSTGAVLLLCADDRWLLVDGAADGVTVQPLEATDFSRPLSRVLFDGAAAEELSVSAGRGVD